MGVLMDDRIAEIREALEWMSNLDVVSTHPVSVVAAATREHLALLDSDALIIRRDKDGGWEELVGVASRRAVEETGLVGFVDAFLRILYDLKADALASSQGVEPQ